jgi:acyl carrier protein
MDITANLRQFVTDTFLFGQANGDLPDDASFFEWGIIDSTGILELIGFLESNYEIKLSPDELVPENLDSIRNLTDLIERKLAEKVA